MKTIFDKVEYRNAEEKEGYWLFHAVTLHKELPDFSDDLHFEIAKWIPNKNTLYFYYTYKDYVEENMSAKASIFSDYLFCEFLGSDSSQESLPPLDNTRHPLSIIFDDVLKQVTDGKGKDRHGKTEDGKDLTFLDQPLMIITRYVGNGYPLGQAMKKLSEVPAILKQKGENAAYQEILGAIAYAASAALYLKEKSIHD